MPFEDGKKSSPALPEGPLDDSLLFYNAFADSSTSNIASAPEALRRRRLVPKRRGSNSLERKSPLRDYDVPRLVSRSRSQREDSGSSRHPLGNGLTGSDERDGDAGITRPHLSRLLNVLDPADSRIERTASSSDAGSIFEEAPQKTDEKIVLVHEVSPPRFMTSYL